MNYVLSIDYPDMAKGEELALDNSDSNRPVYRSINNPKFWVDKNSVEFNKELFAEKRSSINSDSLDPEEYLYIDSVGEIVVEKNDGSQIHQSRQIVGNYFTNKQTANDASIQFKDIFRK